MTDPVLSFTSAALLVVALHSLGLGGALLRSGRPPRRARLALAALAVVIGLLVGNMAPVFSEMGAGSATIRALWLAVGPLFYAYVRCLLPGRDGWEPEDVVHAVPLALQWGVQAAVALAPVADPAVVAAGRPMVGLVFVLLYGLQTVAYAVAADRLVASASVRYRDETAGAEADALAGLRRLTALFGLYAASITVNIGVLLVRGSFIGWLDLFVPVALAAFVAAVGYGLLRRPATVLPELVLPARSAPVPAPTPELERTADALRELMATERPYLDPDVRLGDLARRLAVSERTLSQVLAQAVGGSFYDLVNGYRVAEAQAGLADPALANRTVLSVGLDAGFSSKASFNRVFKQQTGETPSAYRRRALAGARAGAGDGAVHEVEAV